MKRTCFFLLAFLGSLLLVSAAPKAPPNIVIIFTDDQGYGDVGCFGARDIPTPNLDRMAKEGMRFTSFYAAQPVCSASRAALLTGCYPNRVGILGALSPNSKIGISSNEVTIARMLKPLGYATAIFGKWHLGEAPQFLPTRHGFDEYFGLPYSNDMWPKHPTAKFPDLPLYDQEKVIELNPDQRRLTGWYTERAVKFIERQGKHPFFLYVAHNMPHVPLHVNPRFEGKSKRGLYGDVITEIDWSVGEILGALKRQKLDKNTLVVYTSDNGPWLLYGDHAGRAAPLREGKATVFDGGVREPCIMRWPGQIPAGKTCAEMAWTMDLLPTIAALTGAEPPPHKIDGANIWPLMKGVRSAKSPHEAFYYYWGKQLQAVRSGNWKLHLPHAYVHPDPPGSGGRPGKYASLKIDFALFDIVADPAESQDVAAQHPDVVEQLKQLAAQARAELGDETQKGAGAREPGRL